VLDQAIAEHRLDVVESRESLIERRLA